MALVVGKVVPGYDEAHDTLPPGMMHMVYPTSATTHWTILGDQSQVLHVSLAPGEFVIAERGALCYMTDKIDRKIQKLGGLFGSVGTMVGGESIFKWQYSNNTQSASYVGVCSTTPGNVVPVDMSQHPEGILAKRHSWVASIGQDVKISAKFSINKNISCMAGCFGVGPILQTVKGGSWAFLSAYGTVLTKQLAAGESILVDEDAFVACSTSVKIGVKMTGGCTTIVAGGEGLFNIQLTGPGIVILESLSFRRLRKLFWSPDARTKSQKNGNGGGQASTSV